MVIVLAYMRTGRSAPGQTDTITGESSQGFGRTGISSLKCNPQFKHRSNPTRQVTPSRVTPWASGVIPIKSDHQQQERKSGTWASRSTTRWKWQSRRRYGLSRRSASVECGRQPVRCRQSGCRNVRPETADRAYHKSTDFRQTDLEYVLEAKAE